MKKQMINPYMPSWEYVPDGEPHVFGDRLYIYGSHDKFGGSDYCENDYVCYSASVDDLSDWTYEGVIYKKKEDPNRSGIWNMYAPDVAQGSDGRFYLYYSANGSNRISVAVCDSPAGTYRYYGDVLAPDGHVQGTAAEDDYVFDPAVYVEGEHVYLYAGFCLPVIKKVGGHRTKGPFVMELEKDMKTIQRGPKYIMDRGFTNLHTFFEASSIRKFDQTYYFIYSSNSSHELCYATSNRPDGKFIYRGRLYSNGNVGFSKQRFGNYPMGNNHGSIVKIKDRYYVFGHRHTNRDGHTRQGIFNEITRNADGSFAQAEYTSNCCKSQPLLGEGDYKAYMTCYLIGKNKKGRPYLTQDGDDRENGDTQYIAGICDGAVVGFKYFMFKDTCLRTLTVKGQFHGSVTIRDKEDGQPLQKISLNISDKDNWQQVKMDVLLPNGVGGLYMEFQGKGDLKMDGFGTAKSRTDKSLMTI